MASPFGCIAAGRLVETDPRQVDTSRFVFILPYADEINHIVVFLNNNTPFPLGYAATVHFFWPTTNQWSLLGMLSNTKPSAIFKLGGKKTHSHSSHAAAFGLSSAASTDMMNDDVADINNSSSTGLTAQLGISIELEDVVLAQVAQLGATNPAILGTPASVQNLGSGDVNMSANISYSQVEQVAKSLVENFYNFASSFAQRLPQTGFTTETFIPTKALTDWYQKTMTKLNHGAASGKSITDIF